MNRDDIKLLMHHKIWRIAGPLILLGVGAVLGFKLTSIKALAQTAEACPVAPIREGGYKFINPLLICEVANSQEFPEFKILKRQLSDLIDEKIYAKSATKVSVYFRDYTQGRWLTINENEKYAPASLLKVPLMITYFKYGEKHKELMSKKILYEGITDYNATEHFKPQEELVRNQYYTVEDLIRHMIVYSDNNALYLLDNNIDDSVQDEVYTDLGLTVPSSDPSRVDFMNVKSYAYFFRILYNGTYLYRKDSEKALALLAQSNFIQGIKGGIPAPLTVAQKFGERTIEQDDVTLHELHDCGIVYYPNHPYLLCVMTQGYDFDTLAKTVQSISELVYKEQNSRHESN